MQNLLVLVRLVHAISAWDLCQTQRTLHRSMVSLSLEESRKHFFFWFTVKTEKKKKGKYKNLYEHTDIKYLHNTPAVIFSK